MAVCCLSTVGMLGSMGVQVGCCLFLVFSMLGDCLVFELLCFWGGCHFNDCIDNVTERTGNDGEEEKLNMLEHVGGDRVTFKCSHHSSGCAIIHIQLAQ